MFLPAFIKWVFHGLSQVFLFKRAQDEINLRNPGYVSLDPPGSRCPLELGLQEVQTGMPAGHLGEERADSGRMRVMLQCRPDKVLAKPRGSPGGAQGLMPVRGVLH